MNNRSAAREIIILAMPQLPKDKDKLRETNLDQILLSLSRTLSDYAKKNINSVTSDLKKIEGFLLNAEIEHPDNEKHTSQIKPVLIPDTTVLKNQVENLKSACVELYNAIDLPELLSHTTQEQTLDYAKNIFDTYLKNREIIDSMIENAAQKRDKQKKWKVGRMVRLDRDILRLATTELMYIDGTPTEVICDEAVKIADKYGGDESKKFVNGVLRDVVELARGSKK